MYRFLKSRGLDSVAKSLKKAVKDIVVLRDDVPTEEPLLHDIIVEWKKLLVAVKKKECVRLLYFCRLFS